MDLFDENIDVKKFLPHRGSMLMVDKHTELSEKIVRTKYKVTEDSLFNENDYISEFGLIENIAQTCSVIVGSSYFINSKKEENNSDVIGYISTIKSINIYSLAKVNSVLFSKGELISRFDGEGYTICNMKGEIKCNDKIILDCQLNLFIKKNGYEG